MNISVITPVYNSSNFLGELVARIEAVLRAQDGEFELIMVNDGSQDCSWEAIQELQERHAWVRGINLMRNFGQHNALLCGIRAARYEAIVTLDDDLQNPPEEIPKLLAKLRPGVDVVYGKPKQEQHGLLRDIASYVTKLVLKKAMGSETARNISTFRAFRTKLRDAFADYRGVFVSIDVLLTWGTSRFASIAVEHKARQDGQSNYTLRKLVTHAFNMMTGFSVLPLQIASILGFWMAFCGLGMLIYVVGKYLILGSSVPGFPFLASTLAIFSGVQLFAIGIIGEYLARMHFRLLDKPTYAIADEIGDMRKKS